MHTGASSVQGTVPPPWSRFLACWLGPIQMLVSRRLPSPAPPRPSWPAPQRLAIWCPRSYVPGALGAGSCVCLVVSSEGDFPLEAS